MPTHAHGHGYSDLNFLIPELVSGLQFRKGPYFADEGTSPPRARRMSVTPLPLIGQSSASAAGRTAGGRVLGAASPALGAGHLLVAAELITTTARGSGTTTTSG
jgi:hypothetical protein